MKEARGTCEDMGGFAVDCNGEQAQDYEQVKLQRERAELLQKQVKKERSRIRRLFFDESKKLVIDKNKFEAIQGLISQAAFMGVMLDDLILQMYTIGVTETYKNGANQYGTKESTQSKSYNAMVKNYVTVIRTIADLTPEQEIKDELMEFLNKRKAENK